MITKTYEGVPYSIEYDYNQGIFYDISEKGELFVGGMLESHEVNFKLSIKEGTIYVDNAAFMGWENLKEVTFPNSLKKINFLAFTGTSLIEINFNNVEEIASDSFKDCKLEKIKFGNVKSIGINAFRKNNLKQIYLPDNLNLIDSFAFSENNIETVYMPNEIKSLGMDIFKDNPIKKIFATKHFISKHPDFFKEYKSVIDTNNDLDVLINTNKSFRQANKILKTQTIVIK